MVRRRGRIGRRTSGAAARSALLAVVVVLVGPVAPSGLDAQSWKTSTSARQVTNEKDLRVKVEYGAGTITVRRGDEGELYNAVFHFDEEWAAPMTEYADGELDVGLSASGKGNRNLGDWPGDASLDLELAPGVPLDLDLDFGAGRAELDLTGLSLRNLTVNTGASESVIRVSEANRERMESAEINVGAADLRMRGVGNLNSDRVTVKSGLGSVTLRLDGEWPRDGHLVVEMGLGALELEVPRSLGVRLRRPGSFLASIDTDGLLKRGEVYESANWETAERRIEIEITAVVGSVDIDWIG